MSWTDDIRCLFCDGKLPLYRKITHGQFCSSAHRKAYWQEQERLVVERLEQTHNALQAYRPPGAVESILGRPGPQRETVPPDPDPAGLVRELLPARPGTCPEIVAADPIPYEMGPRPYVLFELEVEGLREPLPGESLPIFAAGPWLSGAGVNWVTSVVEPVVFEARGVMRPAFPDFTAAPAQMEEPPDPVDVQIPGLETPVPLMRPCPRENCSLENFVQGIPPEPISATLAARFPSDPGSWQPELTRAPLFGLAMDSIPLAQGIWIDHPGPVTSNRNVVASMPPSMLTFQPHHPALPMAGGRRYSVLASQPGAVPLNPEQVAFSNPPGISLPERPLLAQSAAQAVTLGRPRIMVPDRGGLVPMSPAGQTAKTAQAVPAPQPPLLIPQPPRTQPAVPSSKLAPLAAKPIPDILAEPAESIAAAPKDEKPKIDAPLPTTPLDGTPRRAVRKTYPWTPAADFLKNAPRDLKMLVFAIPVLLGLALHPSLPKVSVSAPASTSGIERNVENAVNTELVTFRQSMLDRAAVALDEDFRSGLDDWMSRGDATAEWSFDATGFVQPGPLALYRPSLGLTDYQLQFLGMIDKKALSWVVRAADFQNYYVVKLVVLKGGPLPTIGVTRYAVLNGKPDARADSIAPIDARSDMLYRVRLDVHGDTFVLVVQGQVVDSWSEPRLRHGGVGFFSARGESSRLRWVQVTHQYDMLGRLCAYLAPYNNSTSNGSFQP